MEKQKELQLPELVEKLMLHLAEKGFKLSYRNRLLAYYKVFLKYADKRDIRYFSLEIGKTFLLQHYKHQWDETEKLTVSQNYLQKHIMMLYEIQLYGEVVSKKRTKRIYCIPHFADVINDYLEQERKNGLKEKTLSSKRHALNQIFEYFEHSGLTDTKNITPACIYGFLAFKSYYSLTTKEHYQYILRSLIKYLHANGLCRTELLNLFPVISIHTKNAYPSYFKPEEIAKMLKCVDIEAKNGKRDYLVLLLAAGLGIRCGDICQLKIQHINWNARKIEFSQSKTEDIGCLSISDEIFYALIDYLKNERPICDFDEILISRRAPVQPFTNGALYQLLQKYLDAANVAIDENQKHGLHAMRSSLASNMLRNGVALPVISNVLGHKFSDTTNIYLKIDLDGLRKSALEVPVL